MKAKELLKQHKKEHPWRMRALWLDIPFQFGRLKFFIEMWIIKYFKN